MGQCGLARRIANARTHLDVALGPQTPRVAGIVQPRAVENLRNTPKDLPEARGKKHSCVRYVGMEEDLYALLGVSRSAGGDEIRRAYRKLAVRWHPDKNLDDKERAEAMFKKVAAAYEILSDDDKRAAYDRYGIEGVEGAASGGTGGGFGGFGDFSRGGGGSSSRASSRGGGGYQPRGGFYHDPFEIFREVFGGRDPFDDFFGDGDAFMNRGGGPGYMDNGRGGHGGQRGFSRDPFGEDPFFGGGGAMGSMSAFGPRGGGGGVMGGGFGGMGGMFDRMDRMMDAHHDMMGGGSSFQSSFSSGGGGHSGGYSKSTQSQTVIVNGRRVTKTTTTIRHGDGREETFTEEHRDDNVGANNGGYLGGGAPGRPAGRGYLGDW